MIRSAWFRTVVLLLVLALAFPPILAAEGGERQLSLPAFWEALLRLVPSILEAEAATSPEDPPGDSPDLGPGLDPAG